MNKRITATLSTLAFLCAFLTSSVNAGEALDKINADVEQKAEQIDQKYGVLLTTQERNDLKIALVVKEVAKDTTAAELTEKAQKAIKTFEITDPTDQRRLLIEIEAQWSTGSTGEEPPTP